MQSCHGLQGLAIPQGQTLHLLCAEGAEAFEALPNAVRGMGPWTGGPEGAIDRLRLRLRVMLNQQGFAVIYVPPTQLELEMSSGGLDGAQRANAECPECHGDGHVPRHGGLRQKTCPRCNGRGWIRAPPAGR